MKTIIELAREAGVIACGHSVDPEEIAAAERFAQLVRDACREELLAALIRISNWNEHTAEFAADYGSNGVRDFYRGIARSAIEAAHGITGETK